MKQVAATTLTVLLLLLFVGSCVFFGTTPAGRMLWNKWFYSVQKADDKTNYETRKQVEDACRAMISSYTSDKITYEMYADSDSEEKRSWAEQARMRANKTAASYNEYILKNSFVWEDNIPADIESQLPYL